MRDGIAVRVRGYIVRPDGAVACVRQRLGNGYVWTLPGGGARASEPLRVALAREVEEEVSLDIGNGRVSYLGCRETVVPGCMRSYEHFFRLDVPAAAIVAGKDPDVGEAEQPILEARWVFPSDFCGIDLKPTFLSEYLPGQTPFFVSENFEFEDYLARYGVMPLASKESEIVHVMLKPDAIENGLVDALLVEFEALGGTVVFQRRVRLTERQVREVYSDFNYPPAEKNVFAYLTSSETHHVALLGRIGLHDALNRAKGKTGSGEGLRGKYVRWFTPLDNAAWDLWYSGNHPQQDDLDLEMFCKNLLHVSKDQATSLQSFLGLFST